MQAESVYFLTLPSSGESVPEASEWLAQHCHAHGISDEQLFHLDLCASELIDNVKEHAYCSVQGDIGLELTLRDHSVSFTVIDDGPPFNPLEHRLAPQPASILDAPVGGLGIHLVREFANSVEYQRSEDGHNRITVMILPELPTPQARQA